MDASRPAITSEAELDAAIAEINALLERDLSPEEEDRLDDLSDAVEAYEAEHHPMTPVSDADMLRFLIEDARRTTVEAVAAGTGIAEQALRDLLAGRRPMTRAEAETLGMYFHVKPDIFEEWE